MLGPELETFNGNRIVLGLVIVLALGAAALVYAAFTSLDGAVPDLIIKVLTLALLALMVFFFLSLRSLRVSLHNDGISYRSLLVDKEMRWEEVERFYYEAIKRSVNFIPMGTYYLYRLMDGEERKIRFGNRVEHPAQLGQKLIEQTYPALYRKISERYNSGQDLDFGAIRVNRAGGIKIKKLFGYSEIPWDQVSSYAIQKGHFYIWRKGQKRTTGWGLRHVPNAFVLLGLLNSIYKPNA
jgi:hypothetical protein